jgi:hypothetical protein
VWFFVVANFYSIFCTRSSPSDVGENFVVVAGLLADPLCLDVLQLVPHRIRQPRVLDVRVDPLFLQLVKTNTRLRKKNEPLTYEPIHPSIANALPVPSSVTPSGPAQTFMAASAMSYGCIRAVR